MVLHIYNKMLKRAYEDGIFWQLDILSNKNWFLLWQAQDAFAQRWVQALAQEYMDNVWARGRNYKRQQSGQTTKLANPTPTTKDLVVNLVSSKVVELYEVELRSVWLFLKVTMLL